MIVFTENLVEFILFFKDCGLSLKLRGKYDSIIYSKFTKTPKTVSAPTSEDSLRAQFRHLVALTSRAHNHLVTEKD